MGPDIGMPFAQAMENHFQTISLMSKNLQLLLNLCFFESEFCSYCWRYVSFLRIMSPMVDLPTLYLSANSHCDILGIASCSFINLTLSLSDSSTHGCFAGRDIFDEVMENHTVFIAFYMGKAWNILL